MTNNELLYAMSNMMDTKLRAELQPLKNEMQDMRSEMQSIKSEMQSIKSDLQGEMQSIKSELQGEMQSMKSELQGEMQSMKSELQDEMQSIESGLQKEIHQIKLCQENVILPRLDTIESCYTDTYRRYRDNADKLEAVFDDVDIMKKVVAEHSKKLQKMA